LYDEKSVGELGGGKGEEVFVFLKKEQDQDRKSFENLGSKDPQFFDLKSGS